MQFFGQRGWRCIAPDMRGYGKSSVPKGFESYALHEVVQDMCELHDYLGQKPAVWIGHDWGSAVVWSLAAHHEERCKGVVNLCLPFLPEGFGLKSLSPYVNRDIYPKEKFRYGQWDYLLFYLESFGRAVTQLEANVEGTISTFFRAGIPGDRLKPAVTSNVRVGGGWFGKSSCAPNLPIDPKILTQDQYNDLVDSFKSTGFSGACSWYMNEAHNIQYALQGRSQLTLPVLFIHAQHDWICETIDSTLAEPMRRHCSNLKEKSLPGGHWIFLESTNDLNLCIFEWLREIKLDVESGLKD